MFVNDTNKHEVSTFPITRLDLQFHKTTDTLRYLTTGPEVGMSQTVQRVRGAAQNSDKKTGESYHPTLALSHRVTVLFFTWCAAVWKANGYLSLCDSDNFTKQ